MTSNRIASQDDWAYRMAAPGTPVRARAAAAVYGATGALLMAAGQLAAAPVPAGRFDLFAGGIAIAVAVLLLSRATRLRPRTVHAALAGAIVLDSLALAGAATLGGALAAIAAMIWLAVCIGALYEPRAARLYAALLVVGLAVGSIASGLAASSTILIVFAPTIVAAVECLSRLTSSLRAAALTDPLTGLLNRGGLDEAARRALARSRRSGEPLTVALIDLDGFKQVNDSEGHEAGDRLLRACAESWRREARAEDILVRLGGDEFALVLPGQDRDSADWAVRRLRAASPTGWSYGLAEFEPGEPNLDACISRADAALYLAKGGAGGRTTEGAAAPQGAASRPARRAPGRPIRLAGEAA